jgi:hypothetical protein
MGPIGHMRPMRSPSPKSHESHRSHPHHPINRSQAIVAHSPFAASLRHFLTTSAGAGASERGDWRKVNESRNAIPMTIPPIKNGVLP